MSRVTKSPILFMGYILTLVIVTAIFLWHPEIDLIVSREFYEPGKGFALGRTEPFLFIQRAIPYLTWFIILTSIGIVAVRQFLGDRCVTSLLQRKAIFIFLSLALGPGLLTNVILKDHWGRARPSQVIEFGGAKRFTPPLLPTNQCVKNCSFVAGDPSVAFFFVAFAFVATTYRGLLFLIGITFGMIVGFVRIVQGGHFLSDVIFSAIMTIGVVYILHKIMFKPREASTIREI